MITIKKYNCSHQFRVLWNKYEKGEQYQHEKAKCTAIYIFGLLVYKHLESLDD
jgi:hypothetical protein